MTQVKWGIFFDMKTPDDLIKFAQKRVTVRLEDASFTGVLRLVDDESQGERPFYVDQSGPASTGFYKTPTQFFAREVLEIHLA